MTNIWFIAALWMGTALLASLISIRIGISVALVEIFLGVLGGQLPALSDYSLDRFPGELRLGSADLSRRSRD